MTTDALLIQVCTENTVSFKLHTQQFCDSNKQLWNFTLLIIISDKSQNVATANDHWTPADVDSRVLVLFRPSHSSEFRLDKDPGLVSHRKSPQWFETQHASWLKPSFTNIDQSVSELTAIKVRYSSQVASFVNPCGLCWENSKKKQHLTCCRMHAVHL